MDDGRSLGLMIRGGAEYGLGIYITGVDPGSAADAGALKVPQHFHRFVHSAKFPHLVEEIFCSSVLSLVSSVDPTPPSTHLWTCFTFHSCLRKFCVIYSPF